MWLVSTTMPANPIATPSADCDEGARREKNSQSRISVDTGSAPTNSAAMPEGSPCCDQITKPLPIPLISTPTRMQPPMLSPENGRGSRARSHAYIRPPASANRSAPLMNGGMVRITIASATKVVPQTM